MTDLAHIIPQASNIEYACTRCGRKVGKYKLLAKRAQFREMGTGGPIVRSRTLDWLCRVPQEDGSPSCLDLDPDYNRPLWSAAPGMRNSESANG